MQGLEGQLPITTVQLWESLTSLGLSSKFLPGAIVHHYLFIILCMRGWCVIQTCQNSSHLVCIYFEEKIMKRVFFFPDTVLLLYIFLFPLKTQTNCSVTFPHPLLLCITLCFPDWPWTWYWLNRNHCSSNQYKTEAGCGKIRLWHHPGGNTS